MVELTKPQQNQYGILSQGGYQYSYDMNTGNGFYPSMFGAPNLWAVDSSGKFTHMWETDGYKQALAFAADLFKAGVFHPDSAEPQRRDRGAGVPGAPGCARGHRSATGLLGHSRHRRRRHSSRRPTSIC